MDRQKEGMTCHNKDHINMEVLYWRQMDRQKEGMTCHNKDHINMEVLYWKNNTTMILTYI